ncbi:DUF1284 domain-containing protein [Breoghania sp.]|uniref:DUF1284 domain-containing protein n=1 Tax=Breoghania sp. TaxID=2065378 RepID=UPI0026086358|nr:DUF1284 domain-containing protein [Breoghania sp.]MDJ0930339.1 DUF1284 domain-containing protein [Breoghania sp.]
MTVELRGHHLLCLLTYVGNGYSATFSAAYDKVVERLNSGKEVEIVRGPDAICRALIAEE